jgi:hypothetical protein
LTIAIGNFIRERFKRFFNAKKFLSAVSIFTTKILHLNFLHQNRRIEFLLTTPALCYNAGVVTTALAL